MGFTKPMLISMVPRVSPSSTVAAALCNKPPENVSNAGKDQRTTSRVVIISVKEGFVLQLKGTVKPKKITRFPAYPNCLFVLTNLSIDHCILTLIIRPFQACSPTFLYRHSPEELCVRIHMSKTIRPDIKQTCLPQDDTCVANSSLS